MNEVPLRVLRNALDYTVTQMEPDVSNLGRALEEPIERGSFAIGMMASAFAMQNINLVEAVRLHPEEFREFVRKCRDLNPS